MYSYLSKRRNKEKKRLGMAHIEKFSITVDTERFWIDGHLASLSPNDLSLNFTTLLERLFKANVTTIKL